MLNGCKHIPVPVKLAVERPVYKRIPSANVSAASMASDLAPFLATALPAFLTSLPAESTTVWAAVWAAVWPAYWPTYWAADFAADLILDLVDRCGADPGCVCVFRLGMISTFFSMLLLNSNQRG